MKRILLLIPLLLLLVGCTSERICVEGSDLAYDGEFASGKLKIGVCDAVPQEIVLNKTNVTELKNNFSDVVEGVDLR